MEPIADVDIPTVSGEDPMAAPTDVNVIEVTVQLSPPPILSTRTFTKFDVVDLGPEITGAAAGTGGGGDTTGGGGGGGGGGGDAFSTKSYRFTSFHDLYVVEEDVESSVKTG